MPEISVDDYKALLGKEVGVSRWFDPAPGRYSGQDPLETAETSTGDDV